MPQKIIISFLALGLIAGLTIFLWPNNSQESGSIPSLNAFAQCLKDKNVVMYGADWCGHCQNQKKLFGESFRLVPYVECPDNIQKCLDLKINGYPTWIFPDATRLEGEQTLETLAEKSGCAL